jgi:xylan 1,4-beta-xylosidase
VPLDDLIKNGVRSQADIGSLAARDDRSVSIMVWNYHDDDLPAPPAEVTLAVAGLPNEQLVVQHYRIDAHHSNSYEVWKKMGSPQEPTEEQYRQLERAGQLQLLGSPVWKRPEGGRIELKFTLPRQGVSLVQLGW